MKYYHFEDYERTVNRTVNFMGLRNRDKAITERRIRRRNNKAGVFKMAYKLPTYYKLYKNLNPKFKNCC